MKKAFSYLVFALLICRAVSAAPPNIVFILVDDLAWADLGCYGHAWHRTPNIDRLSETGVRFTNAYASAPICSASRASILTGKTTARLGFEFVTKNEPGIQQVDTITQLTAPPLTLNLALEEETIAERIAALGYETAFFGKWHLNQHHRRYLGWSPKFGPAQQGFEVAEEDFGAHPYAWGKSPPQAVDQSGKFVEDSMVKRVCRYIGQPHERPYFVMASSFYVHTPVKSPYRWLLKQYAETIPADAPNRQKRIAYAAFLETLDHHVGQIVKAVEATEEADNTLIVFFSDNGGHPAYTANAPLRGSKWNLYEGGIRAPLIARWAKKTKANSRCDVPVIGYDLTPTFINAAGGTATQADGRAIDLANVDSLALEPRNLLWHFPYYHPETGYASALPAIGIDDFAVSQTRPQSALRRGKYKLLWFAEDKHVELYDLQADLSEQVDLSRQLPEKTSELRKELMRTLQQQQARMATPRLQTSNPNR
ncbi:sulfatase [Blastopirellula sp. J2-11]|uniref:sulfatase n=1 Tax=Blastopirellula sp. J2-11 TaxID=2943192 RepID=UPI0021C65AD0|nr:sulfatase [Blastopirellula sp. J2-11]UUO05608.1 sulfatase [Blastopirellula sp. J2-11]